MPAASPCEVELLRVAEVAQLMAMSRSKVYEMVEKGEVPVIRIGTSIRIPRARFAEWLQERTTTAKA